MRHGQDPDPPTRLTVAVWAALLLEAEPDEYGERPLGEPSDSAPGSAARIEVYRLRVEAGQRVFNFLDRRDQDGQLPGRKVRLPPPPSVALRGRRRPGVDALLAQALSAGANVRVAAEEARCSTMTVRRRQREPAFQALMRAAGGEVV